MVCDTAEIAAQMMKDEEPDMVEVIRCRDCTQLGLYNDELWCTFCGIRTKPDNFCAWAVRKDG